MKNHFHRVAWAAWLGGLAGLMGACTGPNKWMSEPHAPVAPEQVKIYTAAPRQYERLGTVTHLSGLDAQWEARADAAEVFADLLKEAGAMGANGLLLVDDTTMADKKVKVNYQGKAYELPVRSGSETVIVQGIFVGEGG